MRWKVEKPQPPEAPAIAEFQSSAWFDTYSLPGNATRNSLVAKDAVAFKDRQRVKTRREILEDDDPTMYQRIAKIGGTVVGFLYGTSDLSEQELRALYVAKNCQGYGIGSDLTRGFLSWCNKDRHIDVGVAQANTRAQKFYKKMGFEAIDTRPYEDCPYIKTEVVMRIEGGKL